MTDYFALDTLVELRDQYSDVYPLSPTGARGWVRARRELPKTDPEAYIEWDKGHWRYHGERDGWTFEHHFRAVDPGEADLHAAAPELDRILSQAQATVDAERCADCGEAHALQDTFLETLMEGQEAALGADGYFMITITPRTADGMIIYQPEIHASTLTDTAQQMIQAQIVAAAAELFAANVVAQVQSSEGQ